MRVFQDVCHSFIWLESRLLLVLHSWVMGSIDPDVLTFVDFVKNLISQLCTGPLWVALFSLYSLHRFNIFLIKFDYLLKKYKFTLFFFYHWIRSNFIQTCIVFHVCLRDRLVFFKCLKICPSLEFFFLNNRKCLNVYLIVLGSV